MQAVYSTTTDVKIHQAIRREWASFQAWLFDQHRRLEHREHEILSAAQRRWGKMKTPDKQQIHGLQEEFLAAARSQWLTRVRHSQLHLEHWVMTPDEKHMLQQTLGWTPKDMVDAYAREQAEMGPMYQRVDPSSLGKNEPSKSMGSPSRFMHPKIQEHIPAYANWAAELAKMPASALSPHRPSRSLKSVELPGMPLYFVGALLQGTDLDAVAASDLEAFAVHVSEEKIREYYSEACEASLHFQRSLLNLEPSQREAAQQDFEHHMRELASAKEREWKAITVKELRRHQALEMERRVMKQRAMRPPPRKATRRPPRRDFLHEDLTDWDLINSPQSSRRDYFEAYQSPPSEDFEAYSSPSPPRRRRAKRRPIPDEEYGEYAAAVSPPIDASPRLRRRNAVHRGDGYDPWPTTVYDWEAPEPEPQAPRETGLRSVLTNWISNLGGAFMPRRHASHETATITSSFDWMEPKTNRFRPLEKSSRNAEAKTSHPTQRLRKTPQNQDYQGWPEPPEPEGYSEEEFPMRKGKSWREKLSWGKGKKRNSSPTSSDIGWADPDSD